MWSQVKLQGILEQQWAPVVPHTSGGSKWICPASHNHLPTFGLNSTPAVLWAPYRQERLRTQTQAGQCTEVLLWQLLQPKWCHMYWFLYSFGSQQGCSKGTPVAWATLSFHTPWPGLEERTHKLHRAVKAQHRRTAGPFLSWRRDGCQGLSPTVGEMLRSYWTATGQPLTACFIGIRELSILCLGCRNIRKDHGTCTNR